ncbi:MAG: cryptochrome/photolyase family protein [Bacteroidetes bacterium]|nr:MAG: cryptochrome/photolyase family protein [Bacteroidota bacterium]TAG87649.1 MAG: cryptochrome/photolyase family protein [Bacteroidota bacterium]
MDNKEKKLRLILGDQLNENHSWFLENDENITYCLMEILPETEYVTHHIQKIIGFFLAMRNFAQHLTQHKNKNVIYFKLDDANNLQSFEKNILQLIENQSFNHFEYLEPDEYRVEKLLEVFTKTLPITSKKYTTEHFLTDKYDLQKMFEGKKMFLMENFYRKIRQKFNILMNGNEPETGKWNYDADNRKSYDAKYPIPTPKLPQNDATEIVDLIQKMNIKTIGKLKNPTQFLWCINREQALDYCQFFVEKCLIHFGTYEDAMVEGEPFLFHSRLSFAMNIKLLSPLEVVEKAISHWKKNQNTITYSQIEGFVRQIIGWREYMRGIYWAKMPEFATLNFFENKRNIPTWFWTGQTKMNCLKQTINQSLDLAFAHHIQRLMITGNFLLLAGINPDEVDSWYLGIYIDALEWVEITNTRGMSQFADGGIVGTKPYVSSANYIDKMSNYCKNCQYDKKKKYGQNACPFNSLYWNFYDKNTEKLIKNPRIGMMYQTWKKTLPEEKQKILTQANYYLENIEKI